MTSSQLSARRTKVWIVFFGLVVLVVALDLWTKDAMFELLAVRQEGKPPVVVYQEIREVVPGFFELEANFNEGAFNGWFSRHTEWLAVLSGLAFAVIVVVVGYSLRRSHRPSWWFILALGLVAGGTVGNLYDRVRLQAVRDWIKWFVVWNNEDRVWPNFNIADSAICVGVSVLLLLELTNSFKNRKAQPEKSAAKSAG